MLHTRAESMDILQFPCIVGGNISQCCFQGRLSCAAYTKHNTLQSRHLILDYMSKGNFHTCPKENVFKMFTWRVICVLCKWQLLGWCRWQPPRLYTGAQTWSSSIMRRVKYGGWALYCVYLAALDATASHLSEKVRNIMRFIIYNI